MLSRTTVGLLQLQRVKDELDTNTFVSENVDPSSRVHLGRGEAATNE